MSNQIRFIREINGQPVADLLTLVPGATFRVASDGKLEVVAGFHATEGTPVNAVAASGTLTVANQPNAGENLTIGSKVYTFTATGEADVDGEIPIGGNLAATQASIVTAIKGTDGWNTAHPTVDCGAAFAGNALTVSAKTKGVAGNSIATTDTLTGSGDGFGAAALASGVDGTVGLENQLVRDGSYLYVATADNTIADTNWRRISLGAAY